LKITEIASHYIKYWSQDSNGKWTMADNAPTPLIIAVRTLPKHTDNAMIYRVFQSMASGKTISAPATDELLSWIKASPIGMKRCDEILQHPAKNKVATLGALLGKAYLTECHSIVDQLHQSLLK
jgi:hypothetical protein